MSSNQSAAANEVLDAWLKSVGYVDQGDRGSMAGVYRDDVVRLKEAVEGVIKKAREAWERERAAQSIISLAPVQAPRYDNPMDVFYGLHRMLARLPSVRSCPRPDLVLRGRIAREMEQYLLSDRDFWQYQQSNGPPPRVTATSLLGRGPGRTIAEVFGLGIVEG